MHPRKTSRKPRPGPPDTPKPQPRQAPAASGQPEAVTAPDSGNALPRDPVLEGAVLAWLDAVQEGAWREYAREKHGSRRRLQAGEARRVFDERFQDPGAGGLRRICQTMVHLAREGGDPRLGWLGGALRQLAAELGDEGAGGAETGGDGNPPAAAAGRGAWVDRLCDWLDAVHHWITHALAHETPERFDPDLERRELATAGIGLRIFPSLSEAEQTVVCAYQMELAKRLGNSPKWSAIGEAAAASRERTWTQPALDQRVILCWPLVKRHNWTYADLMGVVRDLLPSCQAPRVSKNVPPAFKPPLDTVGNFASHCVNALGLRKPEGRRGKTRPSGRPRGYEVARRLFPAPGT